MLIGALVAMFIGIVIAYPASKLVHHFLALSTIAFGELVHSDSSDTFVPRTCYMFTEAVMSPVIFL